MENENDLARLEKIVTKMLGNLNQLKQENKDLQVQLTSKEEEIEKLESRINSMTTDNEKVNSRVTSLIGSIEEWETALIQDSGDDDKKEKDTSGEPSKETGAKKDAQLFSMGE